MVLKCMFLLLAATLVAASHNAIKSLSPNRKADFDYFYLVRQWPATFCNTHACTHNPPRKYAFTVHGFWPQRIDGTWPEFCHPGDELHMDEITDLLPDMEKAWPSWSSSDETFWNHEWTRHGTCSERVIRGHQHQYFATVLRLHQKLNIQAALQSAGITPSNSRRYPVQALKDAIEDEYGVMPHVTCDGQGELAEVWMCINKRLQAIDCADDPHPHRALAAAGGSSAPSNFNCNMVKIPKLGSRGSSEVIEAVAAAAGAAQGLDVDVEDSISATLAQVEQEVALPHPADEEHTAELDAAAAAAAIGEIYDVLDLDASELYEVDLAAEVPVAAAVGGASISKPHLQQAAAVQPLDSQQVCLLLAAAVAVVVAAVVAASVVLQLVQFVMFGTSCAGCGNAELVGDNDMRKPLLNGAICGDVSV